MWGNACRSTLLRRGRHSRVRSGPRRQSLVYSRNDVQRGLDPSRIRRLQTCEKAASIVYEEYYKEIAGERRIQNATHKLPTPISSAQRKVLSTLLAQNRISTLHNQRNGRRTTTRHTVRPYQSIRLWFVALTVIRCNYCQGSGRRPSQAALMPDRLCRNCEGSGQVIKVSATSHLFLGALATNIVNRARSLGE